MPMPLPASTRAPLPRAFRRLAASNLAAQGSEQVALAAAPLVAVLLLGGGAAETGVLQAAQTLPFLLLSLPAGMLADRMPRRVLMAGAEALRTLSLLGILLLVGSGGLNLVLLAGLGFMGTVGTVAYSVAAPALLPALVARGQLAAANCWLELARSAAFSAGPALGGALVGWSGAPLAYAVATAASVLAVVLLAGLPEPRAAPGERRHPMRELAEGVGFVVSHPLLRPVLMTAILFNTAWFMLQAVYVVYAVRHLGLSGGEIGLTLGLYGAGMVAGAVAAPALARRMTQGAMIAAGPGAALAASLLVLATVAVPSGVLAGTGFFLFGAGPILWTIATTTLRQTLTPGALLGRVSAVLLTATFGARPIGAAIGALLATAYGMEACLAFSTVGFALQFLVLAASPVRRLAAQPEPG